MIANPRSDAVSKRLQPQTGMTVVEFLVALVLTIAILTLLIWLMMPVSKVPREAGRRSQCRNNLKQIALALRRYHDEYNALPPAYTVDAEGKPLHSWRTLILPYLEQKKLYDTIDLTKAWDDPVNAEAAQAMPHVYGCPSVGHSSPGMTVYLAVAGPGCCFQPGQPRPFSEITDGLSNTLLVIEVSKPHAVHWMAPQDADETLILSLGKVTKDLHHTGGMHGLLGDGSIHFLSVNLEADKWKGLCTIAGNEQIGEF